MTGRVTLREPTPEEETRWAEEVADALSKSQSARLCIPTLDPVTPGMVAALAVACKVKGIDPDRITFQQVTPPPPGRNLEWIAGLLEENETMRKQLAEAGSLPAEDGETTP
jgi:hypothetical protein